jgi:hypothetical protein
MLGVLPGLWPVRQATLLGTVRFNDLADRGLANGRAAFSQSFDICCYLSFCLSFCLCLGFTSGSRFSSRLSSRRETVPIVKPA